MERRNVMGFMPWVGGNPWVVALLGSGSLVLVVLLGLTAFGNRRSRDLRAWVSSVGRSEAICIDAGRAQGLEIGQTLIVYRSVASRILDGNELSTVSRRFVPIGQARVVTVGMGESLCRFMPQAGLASEVRAGDFVSNRDWSPPRSKRNTPLAA